MPTIDQKYLTDNLDKFRNNETQDVEFSTSKEMKWDMPQAHSIVFDLIKEKFSLSYTKFIGSIKMELYDPACDKGALTDTNNYPDTLDFRFNAFTDHMIVLNGTFNAGFFNIGIYSMDFGFGDKKNLLSNIEALQDIRYGDGIMTPILNGGLIIGTKIQVLLELDLLPLTALKTGLIYYF
jgi:vancomycin resistance protein YoaR